MIMVGIGELGVTCTPGGKLKTMALGSCVAVVMISPKTHCIGLAHIALPDSEINPEKVNNHPAYFANTGIPALIEALSGINKINGKRYVVKLVGGAKVMDENNKFNIGKRNVLAIKKQLWKCGMGAIAEDIGGTISRTVEVDVDTLKVRIVSQGKLRWII